MRRLLSINYAAILDGERTLRLIADGTIPPPDKIENGILLGTASFIDEEAGFTHYGSLAPTSVVAACAKSYAFQALVRLNAEELPLQQEVTVRQSGQDVTVSPHDQPDTVMVTVTMPDFASGTAVIEAFANDPTPISEMLTSDDLHRTLEEVFASA